MDKTCKEILKGNQWEKVVIGNYINAKIVEIKLLRKTWKKKEK